MFASRLRASLTGWMPVVLLDLTHLCPSIRSDRSSLPSPNHPFIQLPTTHSPSLVISYNQLIPLHPLKSRHPLHNNTMSLVIIFSIPSNSILLHLSPQNTPSDWSHGENRE